MSRLQEPYPRQFPQPNYPSDPTNPEYMPIPQNPGPNPMQQVVYQPNTDNTIMMQPATASAAPSPIRYKDYMYWSIFNMLCCCFPVGLAATIYAYKTKSANDERDERASSYSRITYKLNIAALVLGVLAFILIPVIIFGVSHSLALSPTRLVRFDFSQYLPPRWPTHH
ncbi:hypothetical protein AB205_0103230 [Aquarana catesbeiana]|uniref:Uncharacterized protein n=2 Tax=Aquarana catesbeiana TaxID=8400 RepID=A0A2G9RZX1_AQUCT|nr:hypothetical protein AB205_0103230 [Aquarana catesbeiana]